jgi:hypothetical protein
MHPACGHADVVHSKSGYRVEFLPLHIHTNAPIPPNSPPNAHLRPTTEPIFVTTHAWAPRRKRKWQDNGGEYLTMYYVGQIAEDAVRVTIVSHPRSEIATLIMFQVREESTGMPDEQNYSSYLLSIEEALERLDLPERSVVNYAWLTWKQTLAMDAKRQEIRTRAAESSRNSAPLRTS